MVGAECITHIAQKIHLKKIEKAPFTAPMEDFLAANNKPVARCAGYQWRSMQAPVLIVLRTRDLFPIERIANALRNAVPILDG